MANRSRANRSRANLSRLPPIAAVAVTGSLLGLYLGSSAVGEINPAHYGAPLSASRFHSDLVPGATPEAGNRPLPELATIGPDWGPPAIAPDYVGRSEPALFAQPASAADIYPAQSADSVLAEADRSLSSGLGEAARREIERYAHFQVSSDEEQAPRLASLGSEPDGGESCSGDTCPAETTPGI